MKKGKLAALIIAAVLLLAAILLYFDTTLINKVQQTAQEQQSTHVAAANPYSTSDQAAESSADSSLENTALSDSQTTLEKLEAEVPIKSETVIVVGNTPEYELELKICENIDKKTFIKLQYYLNGTSMLEELDEAELPELAGLFESREMEKDNMPAFNISQAVLNPVHSQLYLLIQGAPLGAYTQASLYMVELNDMSIKKLFSYPGLYGKLVLNKDSSLLAYSFGDPPHLSNLQEDNLVEIFDCSRGEYVIKNNRDQSGNILGKNSSPDFLYDYEFEAWQSVNVLKLRQAIRPKKDVDSGLVQTEVLYDIQKNLLLNSDGSEWKPQATEDISAASIIEGDDVGNQQTAGDKTGSGSAISAGAGSQTEAADSEPVKVLKNFYSYLAAEKDYAEAMNLLDKSFQLRLNMLKQFGVDEISKSDIDTDSASVYSELLKAAKFDTIATEVTKDGICTVNYHQILELSADSQIKQFMSAKLKKSDKVWKILLIEDGIQ